MIKVSCELRMRVHCQVCGIPAWIRATFIAREEAVSLVAQDCLGDLKNSLNGPCPVCKKKKLNETEIGFDDYHQSDIGSQTWVRVNKDDLKRLEK